MGGLNNENINNKYSDKKRRNKKLFYAVVRLDDASW